MSTHLSLYRADYSCKYHLADLLSNALTAEELAELTEESREECRQMAYLADRSEILSGLDVGWGDEGRCEEGGSGGSGCGGEEDPLFQLFGEVYRVMEGSADFQQCIDDMAKLFESVESMVEREAIFVFMYDYLLMAATHACVAEYLKTGTIAADNIQTLREQIAWVCEENERMMASAKRDNTVYDHVEMVDDE